MLFYLENKSGGSMLRVHFCSSKEKGEQKLLFFCPLCRLPTAVWTATMKTGCWPDRLFSYVLTFKQQVMHLQNSISWKLTILQKYLKWRTNRGKMEWDWKLTRKEQFNDSGLHKGFFLVIFFFLLHGCLSIHLFTFYYGSAFVVYTVCCPLFFIYFQKQVFL